LKAPHLRAGGQVMSRTKDEMISILFRYFMAASLMRQEFYKHLKEGAEDKR
jgi:hypothetical protein